MENIARSAVSLALLAWLVAGGCTMRGDTAPPLDGSSRADGSRARRGRRAKKAIDADAAVEDEEEEEEDDGPERVLSESGAPMYPPNDDDAPIALDDPAYGANEEFPKAPALGAQFPGFQLPKVDAGIYNFKVERKKSAKLIVFYLGHWCPPCNTQLQDIESIYDDLRMRGVDVVAISADSRDASTAWLQEQHFRFPMAVDVELRYITKVKLRHPKYKAAVHAIYMTDTNGKIFYAKVGGRRPAPQELLDAVDYHFGQWPPAS